MVGVVVGVVVVGVDPPEPDPEPPPEPELGCVVVVVDPPEPAGGDVVVVDGVVVALGAPLDDAVDGGGAAVGPSGCVVVGALGALLVLGAACWVDDPELDERVLGAAA